MQQSNNRLTACARCDGCNMHIFRQQGSNSRFKCSQCDNFDFCASCMLTCPHDSSHRFQDVYYGEKQQGIKQLLPIYFSYEWSHMSTKNQVEMVAYAGRILESPDFCSNPRDYVTRWIKKRGGTEELRIPQDPCLDFFTWYTNINRYSIIKDDFSDLDFDEDSD